MYNKENIDRDAERSYQHPRENVDSDAEREGNALERQGRYTQSRWRWIRLQEEHKRAIERKAFIS